MEKLEHKADKEELKTLLQNHVKYTGSVKAKRILDDFENYVPKFKRIIPADYKKLLQLIAHFEEQGMERDQAEVEAFYEATGRKDRA
jgi:glutamate synthase (ferredoxin)